MKVPHVNKGVRHPLPIAQCYCSDCGRKAGLEEELKVEPLQADPEDLGLLLECKCNMLSRVMISRRVSMPTGI